MGQSDPKYLYSSEYYCGYDWQGSARLVSKDFHKDQFTAYLSANPVKQEDQIIGCLCGD